MGARGDWLKSLMDRRQISVRQIADALEVTPKTVYDWRDERTVINEERVPRLAEILGVSEVEARRGLGFWVPDESNAEGPTTEVDEIDAALDAMRAAIAELERIKRDRAS